LAYLRRCDMIKQTPDPRVIEFIDNTDLSMFKSIQGSSTPENPKPISLSLNHQPLLPDSISVVARILNDATCQPVSVLECVKASLTGMELDILMKSIAQNGVHSLTTINFSENQFGGVKHTEALKTLANLLSSSPTLNELNLNDTNMDDESWEIVLRTIKNDNKKVVAPIKRLGISRNQITAKGMHSISELLGMSNNGKPCLITLTAHENQIGDEGAGLVAKSIQNIESLLHIDLQDNQIGDDGVLEIVKALSSSHLQSLDLTMNNITSASAQPLSHLAQVNETLESLSFLNYHLDVQGLTVMRLLYRYGYAPKT